MNTTNAHAAPTADEARESIRYLTWLIEVSLPHELARTTHARSVARIRRDMAEAERNLSRAAADLGAAVQADPFTA